MLDARSGERDTAIRAMRENVFDQASELRTDGAAARYDDARASGDGRGMHEGPELGVLGFERAHPLGVAAGGVHAARALQHRQPQQAGVHD